MGIPELIMFAISTLISVSQAQAQKRKMKRQQEAAKDKAATREVRITGSDQPFGKYYGRVRVDALDVYTHVSSSFVRVPPNEKEVLIGNRESFDGDKNQTLILQKVLGHANLTKIVFADVDEASWDLVKDKDGNMVDSPHKDWIALYVNGSGYRAHEGPTAQRENTATFDNVAYSTEYFVMNRDDPQYSGKPSTAYYVEGASIAQLSQGVIGEKRFSNNAVEVLFDYLTDPYAGPGLSVDMFEMGSWHRSAAIAEQIVKKDAPVKGKIYEKQGVDKIDIKRYEYDGGVYSDRSHLDNLDQILGSIPGAILYRNARGKFCLSLVDPTKKAEEVAVPFVIDDYYLTSDITYSQSSSDARQNKAKLSFNNSAKDFASDSYEYKNEAYLEKDFGVTLQNDISIDGISNIYQASGIAHALVNESRLSSFTFKVSHELFTLEPGDVIRLSSKRDGIDRYVRIQGVKMDSAFSIDIAAVVFDPSIYEYESKEIENDYIRPGQDFIIEPPSNLVLSILKNEDSILNSIEVSWLDAPDARVIEYEAQVGEYSGEQILWSSLGVIPYGIKKIVHSPSVPATYTYRLRSRTRMGRHSVWLDSSGANVTPQQLLGGLSVMFDKPAIVFSRSPVTGQTFPPEHKVLMSLYVGVKKAAYSRSGDLEKSQWRIVSPMSGSLPNNQGVFSINPLGEDAEITIIPRQDSIKPFPYDSLLIDIRLNGKNISVPIEDSELLGIARTVAINEIVDGTDGTNGTSTALVQLYARSQNQPSLPSGVTVGFGPFSVNIPEGSPWSTRIPTGNLPVWISVASASIQGAVGTDEELHWTTPDIAFKEGEHGFSYFEGSIYLRAQDRPARPDGGSFDFGSNTISPPPGWSAGIPADDGNPIWCATTIFRIQGDTGSAPAGEWSIPEVIGETGKDGVSVFQCSVYRIDNGTPSTPQGGSYDFTNNVLSAPEDWTAYVPTNPGAGSRIWRSDATATIVGPTGVDNTLNWTSPIVFVQNGADGNPGLPGVVGPRGPGWWRAVEAVDQGTLDGYSSEVVQAKFITFTGLMPVAQDKFIISGNPPAVKGWYFNGVAWEPQSHFLDGDLMVDGSVTARKLRVEMLSAITAQVGQLTLGRQNNVQEYSYIRSEGKWWADGKQGLVFAATKAGDNFIEYYGHNDSRLRLSSWGDDELRMRGNVYLRGDIEASSLKADAIDIVDSLNIRGNAVVVPVTAYDGRTEVIRHDWWVEYLAIVMPAACVRAQITFWTSSIISIYGISGTGGDSTLWLHAPVRARVLRNGVSIKEFVVSSQEIVREDQGDEGDIIGSPRTMVMEVSNVSQGDRFSVELLTRWHNFETTRGEISLQVLGVRKS